MDQLSTRGLKHLSEPENSLKLSFPTDHWKIQLGLWSSINFILNLSTTGRKILARPRISRSDGGSIPPRSTISGSELEVAYLTGIKHAKAELRVCEEKKSFKVYPPDSATF